MNTNRKSIDNIPTIEQDAIMSGWGFFTNEISWFLTDFFSAQLDSINKIVFFSYYITGMTLEEIGERLHCSHQAVHKRLKKINTMLSHAWQYSDRWREDNDSTRN